MRRSENSQKAVKFSKAERLKLKSESQPVTASANLVKSILSHKYQYLTVIDEKLRQKNLVIQQKDTEILQKDLQLTQHINKIALMEESMFWKARLFFIKLKLNKLNPRNHIRLFFNKPSKAPSPIRESDQLVRNLSKSYRPKVSIIVPNFNHAKYLNQRLESIYSQTYKNYEVILLDDNSSDDSKEILSKYNSRYKSKTQLKFNLNNSGSVFSQWRSGIKKAKGELIWIAESDDYCDKDFLKKIVPYFSDETVMLTYADTEFVNEDGIKSDFTFDGYVAETSKHKWSRTYVETAHNEVNVALGIKNTIPNVSGVVFRNIPESQFDYESLQKFKVCGDWYFYLSIIRGGRIAFVKETKNYYRLHSKNTASNYQTNLNFIKEIETVAKYIARNYKVTSDVLKANMHSAQSVWNAKNPGRENEFHKAYNFSNVEKMLKLRKPNILMATYSFHAGGGEIIPVRMANKLKYMDYSVTVFNYDFKESGKESLRGILNTNIPVVASSTMDIDSILHNFGIELIHSHHCTVDTLFSRRKNKKIPQVVSMHGTYEMMPQKDIEYVGPYLQNVNHWVYTADKNLKPLIILDWFSKIPKTKIINGFEPPPKESKKVTREALTINKDAFIVCLASRAIVEKGWLEAIDALIIANSKSKRKIYLILIGDGPMSDVLNSMNIDEHVRILDFQENLFRYFSLADVGILPTTFLGESCPLVLIECISAHKPFVSTNVGEIKSMLTLNNGEVAGEVLNLHKGKVDVYELAEILLRLSNDNNYYENCQKNAQQLSKRFSMVLMISKYETIYNKLLS